MKRPFDEIPFHPGAARFWLNSRIASFWLARPRERVETRRWETAFNAASNKKAVPGLFTTDNDHSIQNIMQSNIV